METVELEEGLWRWTGRHEEWQQEVGSVLVETGDGVCLIDPLIPPEDPDGFLAALDRDVERAGGRVHVLVTIFFHARSARAIVERYAAPLWAPARAKAAVERRSGPVSEPFRPGDRLPGGIEALPSGRGAEVVLWLPARRSLVFGDVLLGAGSDRVGLCPESWLPDGTTLADLRLALRPLLELPVERLLVSHGEPVLRDGAAALRQALAG